ncbi:Hypothetical protein B591_12168 [Streptomyces sp. GBA 94-10 4N24]|nr:Hypothetical protein B591_12168 [Streptomyces sp. GBA 94-10 4N24]ESQ04736.1 Hypothetical protein B590_12298 [Streptomyces sp. PVA_94-07]UZN59420.1 Hypothetical protein B591N_12168 [Streptomyces sp. GBA 94-10 4N24]
MAMTLAMAGGVSVAAQTAASASTSAPVRAAADTCSYPYVCLFKNGTRIGQFQDVTSGFQNLPSRPSGPNLVVQNTRNDDVAYIRWSGGTVTCIPPKQSFTVSGGTLTGIRIDSRSTC